MYQIMNTTDPAVQYTDQYGYPLAFQTYSSIPALAAPNVSGSTQVVSSWGIPATLPGTNRAGSPSVSMIPTQMGTKFIGPLPAPMGMGANVNGLTLAGANGLPLSILPGLTTTGANFPISTNMPATNLLSWPNMPQPANGFPLSANPPLSTEPQMWDGNPFKTGNKDSWPKMCEVCSLTLASENQWRTHCEGRKHQKNLRLHRREPSYDPYYEEPELRDSDEEFIGIDESTEYRKCSLCHVIFTSWVLEEAHRLGKKHMKRVKIRRREMKLAPGCSIQPKCGLCNTFFNSEGQLRAHCKGKRHTQNSWGNPEYKQENYPPVDNGVQGAGQDELYWPPTNSGELDPPSQTPIGGDTAEVNMVTLVKQAVPQPMEVEKHAANLVLQSATVSHDMVPPQQPSQLTSIATPKKKKLAKVKPHHNKDSIVYAESLTAAVALCVKKKTLDTDVVAAKQVAKLLAPQPKASATELGRHQPLNNNTTKKEDHSLKLGAEKNFQPLEKKTKSKKKLATEKESSKTKNVAGTGKTPALLPHVIIEKKLEKAFKLYSKSTWKSAEHANDLYTTYIKLYEAYDVAYANYIAGFESESGKEEEKRTN